MPSCSNALGGIPVPCPRETAAPALVPLLRLDPSMEGGGCCLGGRAGAPDSAAVRGAPADRNIAPERRPAPGTPFLTWQNGSVSLFSCRIGGVSDLFGPRAKSLGLVSDLSRTCLGLVLAGPRSPQRGVLRQYAASLTRPDLGGSTYPCGEDLRFNHTPVASLRAQTR